MKRYIGNNISLVQQYNIATRFPGQATGGSSMRATLSLLPLIAAILAVPQFLPQLARLRRTGETAGVSWSWAALTSVNNAAWAGYFAMSGFWTALVPAISATVLAGALAVLLARSGDGVPRRPAALALAWTALLIAAAALFGRAGPGDGADRRLPGTGHTVGLDGVSVRPHRRRRRRHVAAHLGRAALLGRLRRLPGRPSADRPRRDRRRRQPARPGPGGRAAVRVAHRPPPAPTPARSAV